MLGAIVGDIVGSIYERRNIKTKDFPLFGSRCSFTDDTVMTCAVAEAVMNGRKREDFIKAMKSTGGCIRMSVTAANSERGCSRTAALRTGASATARPCASRRARGQRNAIV